MALSPEKAVVLRNLLLVGSGGFLGSIARYYVSRLNLLVDVLSVPAGTLLVNVAGSFLIGFLAGVSDKSDILPGEWRLFLMTGLCGGFTTFSSFTNESMVLLHNGQMLSFLLYTGLSLFLGLAAVFLGFSLTNLL
ncbi:MAG: fluoride efflux transporter CrcB [Bacteroidales bacterium]|jgi:CrcB protein|nr:fluoride efflux transporter CrcB [Bacteroidales bacterium]